MRYAFVALFLMGGVIMSNAEGGSFTTTVGAEIVRMKADYKEFVAGKRERWGIAAIKAAMPEEFAAEPDLGIGLGFIALQYAQAKAIEELREEGVFREQDAP
jgi:hypothetical protein